MLLLNDLVSRGHDTAGQNECYGTTSGSGDGFLNSCIHSDSNDYSSGPTVWYNYVITSAGSITGTNNTNTATESVCPSGWSLPNTKQIDANRDISGFSPVQGGFYNDGANSQIERGYWWGSESPDNGQWRYALRYSEGNLATTSEYYRRYYGYYIRCVSEEKAITSLTYMQDMTPQALGLLSRQ